MSHCPSCNDMGRSVAAVTVRSMLREPLVVADETFGGYFFCGSASCDVVYFQPERTTAFRKDDLRVGVYQKETSPKRLVCYCFNHNHESVVAEARAQRSSILDDITERCRRGEDRCEEANPQGRCCLGNVRAAMNLGNAQIDERPSCCGCEASEPE